MYLSLTDEQQFMVEAARGLLAREATLEAARAALDTGLCQPLWELAIEAGWTGLLSGEDADGAGLGLYDAALVLEACGGALADARLLGHLPACALLDAGGAEVPLRAELASGERRAALIDGRLGARPAAVRARRDGRVVEFTGEVKTALDAPGADVLVVVGLDEAGAEVAALLEDAVAAGSTELEPAYDATRRVGTVRLYGARGTRLDLAPKCVSVGRHLQRALLAAESVGAADSCLAMAREYALDRQAFGRQIGSYQVIKHKLVEMLRRIESARSLLRFAGDAWERHGSQLALAANAARVVAADALDYAAPENIFIHGGIGATWEHDAQLFYRRAEVSRRLAGGAEAAADAVAEELLAGVRPEV
jgi:alkylation response protein AidB-like acyl-CoA dehydrogenase